MRKTLVIAVLALTSASCVPALIGGVYYNKGQRQQFMTKFQTTNTEREEKGLKPLDWCSEAYRFDEKYASHDAECAKRIKAYKAGDATALDFGASNTTTTNTKKKT